MSSERQISDAAQDAPRAKTDAATVHVRSAAALTCVAAAAGLALATLLSGTEPAPPPGSISLSLIPTREVDQATPTLDPQVAAAMAAEAKACRVPMAYVTLAANGPNQHSNSIVRIRSGNYLSPPFLLTPQPQRVAIPFPAAYQAGQGTISLEGNARGVAAHLIPVWRTDYLIGRAPINVYWQPKPFC